MDTTSALDNASSVAQSWQTVLSAAALQPVHVVLEDTPFHPLDLAHLKPTAPPKTAKLARLTALLSVPLVPLVSLLTLILSVMLSAQTACSLSMEPAAALTDRIRLKAPVDVLLALIIGA